MAATIIDFETQPPVMGAVIRGKAAVTSLSFHDDGVHLFVASAEDATVRLVNCQTGAVAPQHCIRMENAGVQIVQATHHNYSILTTGEGADPNQRNHIHYTSVYDNKLLRTFRGHTAEIVNLSINPTNDLFLSSSNDRTVRLWNLSQPACIAQMELPVDATAGTPFAAYDATGLLFGVTAAMTHGRGNMIHLYDARKYEAGPFSELKVSQSSVEDFLKTKGQQTPQAARELSRSEWASLKFDSSGKHMLVTTRSGMAMSLDGFTAEVQQAFLAPATNTTNIDPDSFTIDDEDVAPASNKIVACFTPDDRFILGGCSNGTIQCWEAATGRLVRQLDGHADAVTALAFNPKLAMFASSCTNTALWCW